MDVYIKGMDMPKNCEKCLYSSWSNFYQIYVCNAIRKNEPVLFDKKQVKSTNTVRSGRADNCPLVPVPPHGLIDRERILDSIRIELAQANAVNDMEDYDLWMQFFDYIRKFPAIIPA